MWIFIDVKSQKVQDCRTSSNELLLAVEKSIFLQILMGIETNEMAVACPNE
jgi:hypothetical protein